MEAEKALFDLLMEMSYIVKLHSSESTVVAYQIDQRLADPEKSDVMPDAILDIAKRCGLLEIDRVRDMLIKHAPKIGESDPQKAKVWVTLRNQSAGLTYSVIEYDAKRDSVFCVVEHRDGRVEWEELFLEDIFFDENIGMLKGDKYKNLVADIDGNIFEDVEEAA